FAILRLNSDLVTHYDCLVSDRIAACSDAEIYTLSEPALKKINIEMVLSARNFYDNWLLKKRLGAEILVKTDMVEPEWIECIILDRTARKINGVSIKQLRDSGYNYYF
ncbi:DarT ssDNA thymidine ADP-ribosyltransferase family protein, partial [Mesotoga sp.]|uniref:DarT ssDNA thymidine ADP-ribosyltransferase family protein n=1 Tax=Mesotoga sp. TaxID=2053577 RepID=UPI00345EA8A8